jgi:transcriptional regulator with XRE-family HTH domain
MADELKTLRQVMREAVRASREVARDLERAMGIGNGNLERLLNGTLELRVRHLVAMAKVLNVPPADFLELGLPEAHRTAQHRLVDWVGRPQPGFKPEPAAAAPPAATGDLLQMIRAAVRAELSAAGEGTSPASGRKPK